ncbi:unnamed protein product [Ilex paraguariensis]|uniref:Bifunctional inhibitor/plant lipid transfer protein/seed storage helical domain-containing protein n=1 Tax=Ilex paraguariensis TaxID=185542 RepID=A0ABC8S7N0_9AQUA
MDRVNIFKLAFFMAFLVLNLKTECQRVQLPPIAPRPLCISQFALVNHACAALPFNTGAPPSRPSPPPSSFSPPEHEHRHRHAHGHRHHGHRETTIEQNCCQWLKDVDNECVCDLLLHLPPFLSRPIHQYTVMVDDSCNGSIPHRGKDSYHQFAVD